MVQYVITPWRNRQELLDARAKLYATQNEQSRLERSRIEGEKAHAVAKVAVWVQRGNCPHLVESTAILTSAWLNDVPGNSVYCVRAAYAAAFCRFVTGMLDSHQDKRRKMSMYAIAKTIGLPATYVELRHQATHEELPSLSKLRSATQKALKWIWAYYWVNLSEVEIEIEEATVDECRVAVERIVKEGNERMSRKWEKELRRWDEDRVLDVLIGVMGETTDAKVLMRLVKLQEGLLSPASSEKSEVKEEGSKSLDQVRAELASMERDFGSDDEEEGQEEPKRKHRKGDDVSEAKVAIEEPESKGWEMWAGPWVPKPIGVV